MSGGTERGRTPQAASRLGTPGSAVPPQASHQPSPLPRLSHVRRVGGDSTSHPGGGGGKAAFLKTPPPQTESHLDSNLPVFPAAPDRLRPLLRRGGGASAGDRVKGPEIDKWRPLPHHSGDKDIDEAFGFQNPRIGWFAGFYLTALISLLVD